MSEPLDGVGELDVLVVGAGFSGIYQLYQFRKLGYSVRIFEAASDLGGVWFNGYPGCRVDSDHPLYQLSLPELWEDFTWKERYPSWRELYDYFQYVDRKLDVKKDVSFNTRVVAAHFDQEIDRWVVTTEDGLIVRPRFLVLCVGFASKSYTPVFKGLERFEGICHHTAHWPREDVELTNKRVGVIGTGASGVQIIQEAGPKVAHLTVFQRTPNMTLPMRQKDLDATLQEQQKVLYPSIFRRSKQTGGGFSFERYPKPLFSATPEERVLHWEDLWAQGGFHFTVSNFNDYSMNEDANREVYNFWRDKVRKRIHDPRMQELLAPTIPPHPLGAKRCSLEQSYYEVFNQPNVTLVDLNETDISEVTSKGILTKDGIEHELDVLVLATGFDSLTGGLTQIDIRGVDGVSIAEKWANGVYTSLGMTCANFPNMFFIYGVQAPTAFSNGPTCIEIQGDWVVQCIKHMKENGLTAIYPTPEAEAEWRGLVMNTGYRALINSAKSWYVGANIPGKTIEPLNYTGGVNKYFEIIEGIAERGYDGFQFNPILKKGSQI
ncbi:cyclohexanone monooxygenase [Lentinula detonsa]|uniref:Cyclohexanone monooxygenase n=1 Tax=Lentinula detonsa TaxID=2804962 RepID=A0A9W8U0N3_9AGAR|nr:cyclohexanone monooxygenase [Lentinula detonsa]